MEKLKLAGLFGEGVIPISTPQLVSRYNACLEDMGIEPTKLKAFDIDGMGWSPQISEEREDLHYLTHGDANHFAIILSPDQNGLPVYVPFHSFDRSLMGEVFRTCRLQIMELTTETGIWLDLDNELSQFGSPLDLLMVDAIKVRAYTPVRLMEAARHQRRLIKRFHKDKYAWFDQDLREAIIESAKEHGDLRYRSLNMPFVPFHEVRSYYTLAFGGVYVFRHQQGDQHLLVLEDHKLAKQFDKHDEILSIKDPKLLDHLQKQGLLELDWHHYRNHPEQLLNLKEYLFIDALYQHSEDVHHDALRPATQKRWIAELKSSKLLTDEFFELERLCKQIETNGEPNVSPELYRHLLHPVSALPALTKDVVAHLLAHIMPLDVIRLYYHRKSQFYKTYLDWPEAKQVWVLERIQREFQPKKVQT